MKILINYYSRSGNNRLVAEVLAERLSADIEEIVNSTGYKNVIGLFKVILHSRNKKPAKLKPLRKNPADYDLVILCAPVWVGNLSAPARAYLQIYGKDLKKLAFLAVCGGGDDHNPEAFKEVRELVGVKLSSEMELNTKIMLPEADRNNAKKVMDVHLRKEDLDTVYKEKIDEILMTVKNLLKGHN